MFQVYNVELLDSKDHVYLEYALLAADFESALETAKAKAYNIMDKQGKVIRQVSVKNDERHYMYYTLTKKTERWY